MSERPSNRQIHKKVRAWKRLPEKDRVRIVQAVASAVEELIPPLGRREQRRRM